MIKLPNGCACTFNCNVVLLPPSISTEAIYFLKDAKQGIAPCAGTGTGAGNKITEAGYGLS